MGANFGSDALVAAKGGLTGLGQGLQNYGQKQQQPMNFQNFQQGLQQWRKQQQPAPTRQPSSYPTSPDMPNGY